MTHEPDPVEFALRKVDRSKWLVAAAMAVLLLAILGGLGLGLAHARVDDAEARSKLLFAIAVHEMLFVGLCTGLLAMHVSRTAKLVLRAIELTNKKEKELTD